jgi:hypothetical protein
MFAGGLFVVHPSRIEAVLQEYEGLGQLVGRNTYFPKLSPVFWNSKIESVVGVSSLF